jgi:hypothetical protein
MPGKPEETEAARRARYAAKDVVDKLGIKPGQAVRAVGSGDPELLTRVRAKTGRDLAAADEQADVVLYWPATAEAITAELQAFKETIAAAGGIWVLSSKRGKIGPGGAPYLPDQILIPLGLAAGLVDNKICSISDLETAMRFVIRRSDRPPRA